MSNINSVLHRPYSEDDKNEIWAGLACPIYFTNLNRLKICLSKEKLLLLELQRKMFHKLPLEAPKCFRILLR